MTLKKTLLPLLAFLVCFVLAYSFAKDEATTPKKINICLTMIVKNESRIIERCLKQVRGVADCVSICDTGSTDNTKEIIEKFLERNGIPGKVHQHEWRNFGHNRSLSVNAAQQTIKDLGFSPEDTYLLLLDADMILKTDPDFDKDSLQNDSYMLIQKNTSQSYYNTRLVRASMPWECVGVTHEYWSCKIPHSEGSLEQLWIDDRDDGGCKADKFERDVRLLTQGLLDEPTNERYMFYLAQSYKCLGQNDDAIKWYTARIGRGGWQEEVWFSKMMIGECYEAMNQWDQALKWYLEAYQLRPSRAEPLHHIAKYYRTKQQNQLAYMFAEQGSHIPYPTEDILFVSYPVYDYQFDEEMSICAYYTPFKNKGFEAANRLIFNRNAPDHIKDQAYKNIVYYAEVLPNTTSIQIPVVLPLIREGSPLCYNPMNPSIKKTDQGYAIICRTVNYIQMGGKGHQSIDWLDSTIRTRNFFITLDKDFKKLSQHEITENLPREKAAFVGVEGLEDCRLFEFNKEWWFSCSTFDTNPHRVPQLTLCKLASGSAGDTKTVEKLLPLKGPNPTQCEKNWMPLIKDNQIHFIYSYSPFKILKVDTATGNCHTVLEYDPGYDFSRMRGSAPPIPFDGGYLLMVHEVSYTDQRCYLHRFIYLDQNFKISKMSKPFIFRHKGVEYSCGMTTDHSGKNLVMAVGIEDREAYLQTVPLDTVRSLLEPFTLSTN